MGAEEYSCPSGTYKVYLNTDFGQSVSACPSGFRLAFLDTVEKFGDVRTLITCEKFDRINRVFEAVDIVLMTIAPINNRITSTVLLM